MESKEKARERTRVWNLANKERRIENSRKYYLVNREKILQKAKKYYKPSSKVRLVPNDWITTHQVCQLFNISRERVRQLRNEGKIDYLELSPRILIYPKDKILKQRKEKQNV